MAQCYVHATKIFKRNKKSSNFKDTTTASKRHLSISLSHKQLHRAKYCQHINSVLSESWCYDPAQKPQHKKGDEYQSVCKKRFILKWTIRLAKIAGATKAKTSELPGKLASGMLLSTPD